MTQHDEMADALRPLLDIFGCLNIEYRIGGSVASSSLGRARSTLDVDMVADLKEEHVRPLCEALIPIYYADEPAMLDAIKGKSAFNLIHLATMIKIDVFVLKQGPFDRASFRRSRKESVGSLPNVAFCTAEDMILRKLDWYRAGGNVSDRQWSDILGMLQVQGGCLDWEYLDCWAEQLGVAALLEKAKEAAQ